MKKIVRLIVLVLLFTGCSKSDRQKLLLEKLKSMEKEAAAATVKEAKAAYDKVKKFTRWLEEEESEKNPALIERAKELEVKRGREFAKVLEVPVNALDKLTRSALEAKLAKAVAFLDAESRMDPAIKERFNKPFDPLSDDPNNWKEKPAEEATATPQEEK